MPHQLLKDNRIGLKFSSVIYIDPWWSQNKNLWSGGTSYATYVDPIFWCFSLLTPLRSVKIHYFLKKISILCVWMRSIEWYFNWPYSTFISWDTVHLLVLYHVGMEVFNRNTGCFILFRVLWSLIKKLSMIGLSRSIAYFEEEIKGNLLNMF